MSGSAEVFSKLKGNVKMRRSWTMIVVIFLVVGVIQVGAGRAAKMPKGDTYDKLSV